MYLPGGFIWCERRSFAQEKATSFRESQAVRKEKNNIRSWWSSLQYITWLSFRGCPVVESLGFRCLENIPAEMFCWTAVLPAGHVKKHIFLNRSLQHFPALHQTITILLAMVKTNRTMKTFPRHAWAVHFRGSSASRLRVLWLCTISADSALGITRSFEKLYQLSCESCTMYLNCLDFLRRVHSFLYRKKASNNTV